MNIDGVRVLAQEAIAQIPIWCFIVMFFILLIGGVIAWIGVRQDYKFIFDLGILIIFSDFIFLLISGAGVFNVPTSRNTYKCIFDETVSIQEVYEKYDVVGQDGEIWILEDRE